MLYRSILAILFISLAFTFPVDAKQGMRSSKTSKSKFVHAKSGSGKATAKQSKRQKRYAQPSPKSRTRRASAFPVAVHKVRRDKAEIHSALEESDRENRSVRRATKTKVRQQVQDHIGRDRGVFQVAPSAPTSSEAVPTTEAPRETAGYWDSGPSATVSGMENFDQEMREAEAGLPAEDPLGF